MSETQSFTPPSAEGRLMNNDRAGLSGVLEGHVGTSEHRGEAAQPGGQEAFLSEGISELKFEVVITQANIY